MHHFIHEHFDFDKKTWSFCTFSKFFGLILLGISPANAGERIVLFGDSHTVGGLGEELKRVYESDGATQFSFFGLSGANPRDVLPSSARTLKMGALFQDFGKPAVEVRYGRPARLPPLPQKFSALEPTSVFFEFGDNLADYATPDLSEAALALRVERELRPLREYLAQLSPMLRCRWISPLWSTGENVRPYFKTTRRLQILNRALRKGVEGFCEFVDSTEDLGLLRSEVPTGANGLHYLRSSYRKWAKAIQKRAL